MGQYLTAEEEKKIREFLDNIADEWGLYCEKKETHFSAWYVDRLWYKILEGDKIPLIAFEIEKSIPNNEKIRKDIMNIAWTKAPLGYIILPHSRIFKRDPKIDKGWRNWYKNSFFKAFDEYRKPFIFFCDIRIMDADKFLSSRSLKKSALSFFGNSETV